ncbi:putative adenylyltransferase/sulfurtransferase MoeZ [bacterium BMS3Bbin10]|nr:putative adenylyltransferase/sulfurtransferase MoeZ [bacterium BMS3Bbin10]
MIANSARFLMRAVHLALLLLLLAPVLASAKDPVTLDAIRAKVRQDYPGVQQLSTKALAERIARGAPVVLLDVREKQEFAVSRIRGAQRVDPGIWRSTFMNRFGDKLRGKTVVFYCSVGVRSSRLAASVQAALKERGVGEVYNLDGGVFAWHNEMRPLENGQGATDFVHPYDKYWGKLVDRRALVSTTPK